MREKEIMEALIALDEFSREITSISSSCLGLPGNVEIQIMLGIHFRPGITPGGIAATTGFRGSAVARTLKHLEDEGLIVRVPAPFDGRTSNVRLTRKGRGRVARFDEALADLLAMNPSPVAPVLAALRGGKHDQSGPTGGLDAAIAMSRVGAAFVREVNEVVGEYGVEDFAGLSAVTLTEARGAMRPRQLGEQLRLSSSGTSDLLDRLEAAGLVDRRHDEPDDRRAVMVRLTTRGKQAAHARRTVFARHIEPIAAALSLAAEPTVVDGAVTA